MDEGSAIALLRVAALTISSVEFSVNSALATHLFVVNGGSLTFESSVSVGSTVNSLSCASQTVMSVLVHKCKFNDCNVTSADAAAGAVYAELGVSMTVTETNFTLCTSNCSTGAIHIHMISTTAVSNCEFVECTAGMYTGALRFTTQMSYILSSSLFLNCSCGLNGGGFDSSGSISTAQVLLIIFRNCSSGNNGGGFYQTFNPSTAPEYTPAYTFSLENCTFDNCTAGDIELHRLRISTALFPSSPADGIAFTRSQRLSAAFAENTTVYTARCSVLVRFNHSSNGALTIDSENGLDEERCGESTVPCETLTRGVGGIAAGQTLRIRSTASLAQIVTISKEMTWTHAEATTGSVSVKTGGSISVASGQLNLVKIEFSSEATVKLTTSLLVVSSGSLSVTSCSFTKISSSADGSCISASLSTNSLSIADAAFKTCSSDGSGGAVCDHLGVVLKLCLLFDWAWQMDLNEPAESKYRSMSLLLYITKYEATTVEMGSSGRDLAGCGLSQWRRKEVDVSSTHLAGVGLHTISVVDSFSLNEPPSFSTNEITVSSPSSTTKISVSSAATISISGHTLTLSSLLFDGLSLERSTALISLAATGAVSESLSSSNSLNLNTVHFSKCESEKGGPLFVDVTDSTAAGKVTFVAVTFGTGSEKNVGAPGNNLYLKCSSMSSASDSNSTKNGGHSLHNDPEPQATNRQQQMWELDAN
ncbi:hypothetical protein BLNAU_2986 [Blattamonas nauphoetae]|uniref:Uncharacterized protein n=1 Tax=Blattamonas nauphoetae TaxID=2049346 RepID=A0ABQ9YDT1_9EUKA|nr:hypothetical protein BLNAU_2986 [Blattamonas nauphoetae]